MAAIRLAHALERYNPAWLEDMIPWQYTDLLKEIKQAINVPLLTGEDIYLKEGFINLASNHAVDILHPDLATSGGILATGLNYVLQNRSPVVDRRAAIGPIQAANDGVRENGGR